MINRGRVRLSPATLSAPGPAIQPALRVRSGVILAVLGMHSPGGPLTLATRLCTLSVAMTRMTTEHLERKPQGFTMAERDQGQAY